MTALQFTQKFVSIGFSHDRRARQWNVVEQILLRQPTTRQRLNRDAFMPLLLLPRRINLVDAGAAPIWPPLRSWRLQPGGTG